MNLYAVGYCEIPVIIYILSKLFENECFRKNFSFFQGIFSPLLNLTPPPTVESRNVLGIEDYRKGAHKGTSSSDISVNNG
jgi:hypothetical protein